MPRGVVTWTPALDGLLLRLFDGGVDLDVVSRKVTAAAAVTITECSVRARLNNLGRAIRRRHRDAYFTAERDAQLRAMWVREPRMLLAEIRDAFGGDISAQAISQRAMQIGLTPRHASAGKVRVRKPQPEPATPGARVLAPLETPCPFYHPMEMDGVCGVMVNRRPAPNGVRPSQYCSNHEHRVLPLSRGAFGAYSKLKVFA